MAYLRSSHSMFIFNDHQLHYSMKPPVNPFTIDRKEAQQIGYPSNVDKLNIPKLMLTPRMMMNQDGKMLRELLDQFRDDLLGTSESVSTIMQKYTREQVDFVDYLVIVYFENIQTILQRPGLQYGQVMSFWNREFYENFVCYGSRFWEWCVESNLYTDKILKSYSILLFWHMQLYPNDLRDLHNNLRQFYRVMSSSSPSKRDFSISWASYKPKNPWEIHDFIKREENWYMKGDAYYKSDFPSINDFRVFFEEELKRCFFLHKLKRHCHLEFKIEEVCTFSHFSSVFRDLFVWKFSFYENYHFGYDSDWSTVVLALSAVRKHFAANYGILFDFGLRKIAITVDGSFYKIENEHLKFTNVLIRGYAEEYSQVVEFYSSIGNCSAFMSHLFFWAHQNSLLDGTLFHNFNFGLLIVFFLEHFSKKVHDCSASFPTIQRLREKYANYISKKSKLHFPERFEFCLDSKFQDKMALYYAKNCIGNCLIFYFFEFYHNFDFSKYVICPYDGQAREKKTYELTNNCKLNSMICIEGANPIIKPQPNEKCTEERMQQFKQLIDRMYLLLKDCNQPEMFYIEVLTNPEYFLKPVKKSSTLNPEIPNLSSEKKFESTDVECKLDFSTESISDSFADLFVNDELTEPIQNEEKGSSTVNDHNQVLSHECEDEENGSNNELPIDDQTESKEDSNNEDEEDQCRLM